jgi:hypothetical protein
MEMTHLWKSTKSVDSHKLLGKAPPKKGGPFPHSHRPYEVFISKGRIHLKQAHFLSNQWGTLQITMVRLEVFQQGHDVYLDYPFEDVMFRWEHKTRKVFGKFYGEAEVEVDYTSNLFHEAISAGEQITAEKYAQGESANQQ